MKSSIITALDIGSTMVRTVIAKTLAGERLEVLGIGECSSEGIQRGIVKDIQALSEQISKSISDAEKAADTDAKNIYTNITGDHIRTQLGDGRISIPSETPNEPGEISIEHVEQVINDAKNSIKIQKGYERHKILHGIPHDYIIDSQDDIHNPVNMSGFHLTAKVLTILSELTPMRNLSKCIELAGYEMDPDNYVLTHVALSSSILSEDERRLGAILMDVGGGTCDISIYNRGALEKVLVIPMAGQSITEDLAIGLKTTLASAEYIKTQFGNAIASDVDQSLEIEVEGISGRAGSRRPQYLVSHVIQHRVEEMLAMCYNRSKDFYTPELVTAGVILCGGSAKLQGMDTAIYNAFNLQVKIANPDLSRLEGGCSRLDDPAFATAVGILYYAAGFENEPQSRSLNLSNLGNSKFVDKLKKIIKDFT
ncbi:MAG: cell division protein FtsA [Candidatus Cloacimonetes bacterium]|jgi:cell division protein FtsA|nr:cell division protein FtsA [Candidatus Cloacimonadota bacterium]MDY0299674.1 cell division protein FtsA [Candidatus Cloacimonadaceae bacterium]MCB5279509.1 cell division protein FtsA [Candidatus Cloacimonadota bacterium]MCK9332338.1 cell division protein FtsA [Candidatus Cloacimonadota bacterium]MDD2211121.1 cell division protein FtsA [Candidatus Cloacimonadota bacterium]